MNYEKIVALFDTGEHAEAARRNLESAGFPGGEISVCGSKTLGAGGETLREPGLWRRLFGRDIEQHEAAVYGRTCEQGGMVLSLRVPESDIPRAMGILNAHKVVDVQQRAVEHGILSPTAATAGGQAAASRAPAASPASGATASGMAASSQAATTPAAPVTSPVSKDQVLRLAEEQLDVGKRLVQEGTTRIRRFVTERPVEAKVTLHEEHANVVRRAVSEPGYIKDIDWSDKTVEVAETAEEPVVTKSARIAEEVVISKTGTDRVETVHDTVRRQQVDIQRGDEADKSGKKGG